MESAKLQLSWYVCLSVVAYTNSVSFQCIQLKKNHQKTDSNTAMEKKQDSHANVEIQMHLECLNLVEMVPPDKSNVHTDLEDSTLRLEDL